MPATDSVGVQTDKQALPPVEPAIPGFRKSKKSNKRKKHPLKAEDFVDVIPVQLKDDEAQPMQVRSDKPLRRTTLL